MIFFLALEFWDDLPPQKKKTGSVYYNHGVFSVSRRSLSTVNSFFNHHKALAKATKMDRNLIQPRCGFWTVLGWAQWVI